MPLTHPWAHTVAAFKFFPWDRSQFRKMPSVCMVAV